MATTKQKRVSTNTLSVTRLRELGYFADIVERQVSRTLRKDLFSCIDVIAIKDGIPGVLAVQATTIGQVNAHVTKIHARPEFYSWLNCGNRFEVWRWNTKTNELTRIMLNADQTRTVIE